MAKLPKCLKGFMVAALVFAMVWAGSVPAEAHHHRLKDHRRVMACHDIDWQRDTARFIRCAAAVWNAPDTPDAAVAIARCESGLNPNASNGGRYVGLFQHAASAWRSRVYKYLVPLGFSGGVGWSNGEANTIVAMRMAKGDGTWSRQWACA